MSSVVNPQPDPSAEDELVAYLDGELAPDVCRRVESRLATDDDYRQQLHELDQAWEALDVLPANTVDDGFARTTIELACVAAEADLTENTANAQAAKRHLTRRWIAAAVAAVVVGFLVGRALISNRNEELVNDLPAIQQFSVLPYVKDAEFLRQLATAVPSEQLIKDDPASDHKLKELETVNNPSPEVRRDWIQSLPPDQKAQLADRSRAFNDLEPASNQKEHMRSVMEEIRRDPDTATLHKTLVAYGQWLSRHSDGQKQDIQDELHGKSSAEQATLVAQMIRREEGQPWRHLSADDANTLRDEILKFAVDKKADFSQKMMRNHRGERLNKLEQNPLAHALVILYSEMLQDNNFEPTANQFVAKLSSDTRAHWESLEKGRRDLRKPLFAVWVRDAIRPKLDPEELERFFASDEITNVERQRLLDMQRPEMEAALKRDYLSTGLGFDANQLLREFGEPGRMPRFGSPGGPGQQWRPDGARPDGMKRGEPGGPGGMRKGQPFGPGRPLGPDGRPIRRPNEKQGQSPNQPPPPEKKPEAI